MKNVIISIDDEFHELVEDKQEFECEDCSLFKYCAASGVSTLCGFFSDNLAHFKKIRRRNS